MIKKLIFVFSAILISSVLHAKNYSIKVSAKIISNNKVELKVKTDIPLPVTVSAGIDLKGQKDDDIYIGYSENIKLTKPLQIITLNFKDSNLPTGKYLAVVTYYHRWGADGGNPEAKKITKSITASDELSLVGGGESVKEIKKRSKSKRLEVAKEEARVQCYFAFKGFIRKINPRSQFLNNHADRWTFKLSKDKKRLFGKAKKYVRIETLGGDEIRDATCTYFINPGEVTGIGISDPVAKN